MVSTSHDINHQATSNQPTTAAADQSIVVSEASSLFSGLVSTASALVQTATASKSKTLTRKAKNKKREGTPTELESDSADEEDVPSRVTDLESIVNELIDDKELKEKELTALKVEVEALRVLVRDLAARLQASTTNAVPSDVDVQPSTSRAYQWVTQSAKMALKKAQVEVPVESVQESNVANFVLSEFGLREKKKKNVIVFGVPESKSSK